MSNKFKNIRIIADYCIRFGTLKGWRIFRLAHAKTAGLKELQLPGYPKPILLRHGTSDVAVFEQIMLREEYRFSAKMNLDHIRYIVDCGANTGLSSLYFHTKFQQAKIVAVELEKSNYEMLEQNVAGITHITPLHAGVWSKNTLLQMKNSDADNWSFQAKEGMAEKMDGVEGVTIPELMKRYQIPRIDILKIDIEGAEIELFRENSETFLPQVRYIVIEFHDWIKPNTARTFFNAISDYNYFLFPNGENVFCELLHPQPLHLTYPDV